MYIKGKKAHNLIDNPIEQYKSSSAHLTAREMYSAPKRPEHRYSHYVPDLTGAIYSGRQLAQTLGRAVMDQMSTFDVCGSKSGRKAGDFYHGFLLSLLNDEGFIMN